MKQPYQVVGKVDLIRIFEAIEVPDRIAIPIVTQVYDWVNNSGPEWTVERLKNLKTLYLQHYAGNKTFRLDLKCKVACHKDGSPKGCFHALWTLGSSRRTVNKILTVLMSYSSFILTGAPTERQWRKFEDAVERPPPSGVFPEWDMTDDFKREYKKSWDKSTHDLIGQWTSSSTKKVVSFDQIKGLKKVYENSIPVDKHFADFIILCNSVLDPDTARFFVKWTGYFQFFHWESFLESVNYVGPDAIELKDFCKSRPIVGSIGFIQERGAKLRAVANPLRTVQCSLSRLNNMMKKAVKSFPWDCTFDQERGVRWAEGKLRSGVKLFSFDLSNASDTIPLEDQISFLKHVGPPLDTEYEHTLKLFEKVSRGYWLVRIPGQPIRFLRWTKGQALGISCSFNAFAQLHGARLLQLSLKRGIIDSFVVLGDDVIVVEDLAEPYLDLLKIWGCEISLPKSISSNNLAEFASKLVTDKQRISAFKYPKNVRLFSTHKPLELLRKFGKRALSLVPKRFRDEVQLMSTLKPPHGLGWRWSDDELVWPSGYTSTDVLVPPKREKIPDVAHVENVGRQSIRAAYDSIIVREQSLVEREQDLEVAFLEPELAQEKEQVTLAKEELNFNSSLLADFAGCAETTPTLPVSPTETQWAILHADSNLANEAFEEYDEKIRSTATLMPPVSRETHVFEEVSSTINPTTSFQRRMLRWVSTTIGLATYLRQRLSRFRTRRSTKS